MTTLPCTGRTSIWYSDTKGDQATAKAGCQQCPQVVRCLVNALRRHERYGVWGSFTADERAELVRSARRQVTTMDSSC